MEKLKIISGPCVIESYEMLDRTAAIIKQINKDLGVEIIFKASFDKANRSSITSYRGPGIDKGLQMLHDIKEKWDIMVTTDIHETCQASRAGEVVDILQIPAFLCRQTDLIVAASKTGKIVNIKKAQFLSGEDMYFPYQKAMESGAVDVWLTERGNKFGYDSLIVDFRNIVVMHQFCKTVIMDCTHSVQNPVSGKGVTGGSPEYISKFAEAAKAFGVNGYFFEVHEDPASSKCDSGCILNINKLSGILNKLI